MTDWIIYFLHTFFFLVKFLEDECRSLRRKAVDLEASNSKLKVELANIRGDNDENEVKQMKELEGEPKQKLAKKILELENELGERTCCFDVINIWLSSKLRYM